MLTRLVLVWFKLCESLELSDHEGLLLGLLIGGLTSLLWFHYDFKFVIIIMSILFKSKYGDVINLTWCAIMPESLIMKNFGRWNEEKWKFMIDIKSMWFLNAFFLIWSRGAYV